MYFALSLLIVTIVVCCSFIVIHNIVMVMVHCGPLASLSDEWLTNPKMITIGPAGIISLASFDCQTIFWSIFFLFSVCKSIPSAQDPLLSKYLTVCQAYYQHNLLSVPSLVSSDCSTIFWSLLLKQQCAHLHTQIAQNPLILKIYRVWKYTNCLLLRTCCSCATCVAAPGFHCPLFILKSPPQVTVCTSAWSLAPGSCSGQVVFQCIAWLSTPAIVSTVLDWQIWARLYCST